MRGGGSRGGVGGVCGGGERGMGGMNLLVCVCVCVCVCVDVCMLSA
jgi:hypothetical protein